MAAISIYTSTILTSSYLKPKLKLPHPRTHCSSLQSIPILTKLEFPLSFKKFSHLRQSKLLVTRAKSDDLFEEIETGKTLLGSDGDGKPVKFLLLVLLWASVSIGLYAFSGDAKAASTVAAGSIRASGSGVKVVNALWGSVGPKRLLSLPWLRLPILSILGHPSPFMPCWNKFIICLFLCFRHPWRIKKMMIPYVDVVYINHR